MFWDTNLNGFYLLNKTGSVPREINQFVIIGYTKTYILSKYTISNLWVNSLDYSFLPDRDYVFDKNWGQRRISDSRKKHYYCRRE